ncbi:AraC family transcriptional regulator [Enterobacter sp. ENT03]|uniref:AraC family transcriptional regulator n=1 Tax=Enterobacter sp. ENT03 TaxID=2854780 RepID=UPI001C444707|nr:AraC family transcriptional regulator [Enterobacter sp. ENT03]MBV7405820.1 AraC family transcriptional regulator [Enterobacter sp. ENT03]
MSAPYRHEIIATDAQTLAHFIWHAGKSDPVARHWHKSLELSYTLSGSIARFEINGRAYATSSGQILIVNPNEVHAVETSPERQAQGLTVIFPYQFLQNVVPGLDTLIFDLNSPAHFTPLQRKAYRKLQHLLNRAAEITASAPPSACDTLLLSSMVYQLLYWLVYAFSDDKNKYQYQNSNPCEKIVRVTAWIDSHFHERLTSAAVARHFYISETWFSHLFKQHVGKTFHQYLVSVRLNAAMTMLFDSNLRVQIVAERSGFPNFKSFVNYFKQAFGMTPLQYRKSRRQPEM